MTKFKVVDTNVLIAANGRKTHADLACQLSCIEALEKIISNEIIVIDDLGLIMDEYERHCSYKGEPGVGDYFFKYVHDNQLVYSKCLVAKLTWDDRIENSFLEFPDHPDLISFDFSDRKFVAVSISSNVNPDIYNATDSDWADHKAALDDVHISVIQLCPQHASK